METKWEFVSGPDRVAVDDPFSVQTHATFTAPGLYVLKLTGSDGVLTSEDTLDIRVSYGPTVVLNSPGNGSSFDEDSSIPLSISALDEDGTIENVGIWIDDGFVGFANKGQGHEYDYLIPQLDVGVHHVFVTAEDDSGFQSQSESILILVGLNADESPLVEIISPNEEVVSSPVDIVGTVHSDLIDHYELHFRSCESQGEWSLLARAGRNVESDSLGVFDSTLLRNGQYEIRLVAYDQLGRSSTAPSVSVIVDGGMKAGQMTVSFEDLSLPVSGIPIQLIRTYDSRDALAGRKGDFGPGWSISATNNIRLIKNRNLGRDWFQKTQMVALPNGEEIMGYALEPVGKKIVCIVFPDDQVFAFEAKTDPAEQTGAPIRFPKMVFEPLGDTLGTLEVYGNNRAEIYKQLGETDLHKDDYSLEFFNPTTFRFTTIEGNVLIIDEEKGLLSITDSSGNALTFDDSGIRHSSGKSIVFERNEDGQITFVTDAEGNHLSYEYDDLGRLKYFWDREGSDEDSPLFGSFTEFRYENENNPYYLTSIIDPQGNEALTNEYDSEGRLIQQSDADGHSMVFEHDILNFTETVTDRLGNSTVHTYDFNGNIVKTTNALGYETTFAYDERDNQIRQTDHLGKGDQKGSVLVF